MCRQEPRAQGTELKGLAGLAPSSAPRPAPLSQAPGPPSTALPAMTTTGRQVVLRRRVPELRDRRGATASGDT